jgi:hypothetical protein
MTEELAHFNARERVLGWDELGRALVFDVRGQPAAAAALLQKVCPSHAALEPDCSREAVRLAALLPDAAPLEAAARLLRNGACRSSSECALGLEQLGAAYEARGELGRAASTYVEAAEAEPNASRYARAAHAAERARLFSMALNAYQSASHLEAGAAYDGDVQRLRELILLQNSPPDVLPTP